MEKTVFQTIWACPNARNAGGHLQEWQSLNSCNLDLVPSTWRLGLELVLTSTLPHIFFRRWPRLAPLPSLPSGSFAFVSPSSVCIINCIRVVTKDEGGGVQTLWDEGKQFGSLTKKKLLVLIFNRISDIRSVFRDDNGSNGTRGQKLRCFQTLVLIGALSFES